MAKTTELAPDGALKPHEFAQFMPPLLPDEMAALRESLKIDGQQYPILLFQGQILDGWHRYQALCGLKAKIAAEYFEGTVKQAIQLVAARYKAQLKHRTLTTGQKAMVAAKMANAKDGRPRNNRPDPVGFDDDEGTIFTRKEAADIMGVGLTSVILARFILQNDSEISQQVATGKLVLDAGHRMVKAKLEPPKPVAPPPPPPPVVVVPKPQPTPSPKPRITPAKPEEPQVILEKSPEFDRALFEVERRKQAGEQITRIAIQAEADVSAHTAVQALAYQQAVEDHKFDKPEVHLSERDQKQLDVFKKRLERDIDQRVETLVRERIDQILKEMILPAWQKRQEDHDKMARARKGIFQQSEFNKIMRCLHPDTGAHVSDEMRSAAFQLLNSHKIVLLSEKEMPTNYEAMPKTVEELWARRQKMEAEQRARRKAAKEAKMAPAKR